MFKTIWNWILGVERSIEDHLAPLLDIITNLEHHAEQKAIDAAKWLEESVKAKDAHAIAAQEATAAQTAAEKIKGLVQ